MHCSASDTLLGKAPVWLSCIILMIIGAIVGAVFGAVGMLFRTRKLQRAKYRADDMPYPTAYQPAAAMQAQDSAYKSTWRAAPSGTQSGHGTPTLSSKDTSLIEDQKLGKGPADQRLLQEDAIRRSGVSGPLGMGVVMQSMSKEAGQLYPGASPEPQRANAGYSRAASTSHTASGTQMAAGNTEHRTMGDGSRIEAWHGHSDAKENIASALNPAYSHDKIVAEQSPARGPADRSYALQAIQNSNNAGAAMGGHAVVASRGPAMLNDEMRYAEFSSTPPLAATDSPIAASRSFPGASSAPAGGQYMAPPATMRPAQPPADRTNLPMAPPPPRQSTVGGPQLPPPPPPPPAQLGPAVKTPGPHLLPSQNLNARSPAPPPPPPPPPQQGIGSVRGTPTPPPPPPPPPPRGPAGQPTRAPPPPSRPAQLSAGHQQGQGSSIVGKQSNGGGTGVASIAEQAAQRAANRGKPPVAQVAQSQPSIHVAQTTPGQDGPASLSKGSSIATASAAHRHAPSEAYELEDLDEDWVAMLNVLDSRLLEVGRPTMMAKERAVAVRSLLVSTGTEKPDVALQKAIEDIERYRRIH